MAPVIFNLLSVHPSTQNDDFISKVKALPASQKPLWFGKPQHWMHEPRIGVEALLGPGPGAKRWDYVLLSSGGLPEAIKSDIASSWSITGDSPEGMPPARVRTETLRNQSHPTLPKGWSNTDSSALDAATTPEGVEFSLNQKSKPLGSSEDTGKPLKEFVKEFTSTHPGPVAMFNLLSYQPNGRPIYFDGYVAGFGKVLGPKFAGEPVQMGFGVSDWTSKVEDEKAGMKWEDAVLVWYPTLWHFAAMFDDPDYAELDRKFKPTSLIDNPLICCTEIEL